MSHASPWHRAHVVTVLALALGAAACLAAQQPDVPQITRLEPVYAGTLEVDAGQQWAIRMTAPKFAADECPVLSLRARLQTPSSAGCNYVLQVLVDDARLSESFFRKRLINKLPWFDPPGTKYHFSWYDARRHGWMTIFGPDYHSNWGGTGRDFDFVFDLSGLVASGRRVKIGFAYLNPGIPQTLKLERAPLMLDMVALGVMQQADVERLRKQAEANQQLKQAPVRPQLPLDAKRGPRAYELAWSGRPESPRPQVAFGDLSGWTLHVSGDVEMSLEASVEQLLWRKQVAKLNYANGTKLSTALLRPAKPIDIGGRFDTARLWLYGGLVRRKDAPARITAHLEDSAGRDYAIDLGRVTSSYWGLQYGVLDNKDLERAQFPMRFLALSFATRPVVGKRRIYLESLAFYLRPHQPYTRSSRPAKPTFPTSDDGMLPTPPAGVRVEVEATGDGADFISKSPAGTLRYRVRPEAGVLHGVTAQWQDGKTLRPMDRGGIDFDLDRGEAFVSTTGTLLKAEVLGRQLQAQWRYEVGIETVEWAATYELRGRTLVVDVSCSGGKATGLRMGRLTGMTKPRRIEVPYLMLGPGYGPIVAAGDGVFAAAMPDWYHTDCSEIDARVSLKDADPVKLMRGTRYSKLTNGHRNPLRDRILVTVSPEFADTLPNARNPVSPNRERLASWMFHMASTFRPNFWRTLKRYGIERVIACDFGRTFVKDYAEGFAGRWRPHPSLTVEQVQAYRKSIKDQGYLFGAYIDVRDFFPLNEFWTEERTCRLPNGDLRDGWYGNFTAKPNYMAEITRRVGQKVNELYPADCVYMDVHTNISPVAYDYEAGAPGAGMARATIIANGDCIVEARKWYGSTMSEGIYRWLYAGLSDMDYSTMRVSQQAADAPPLVDFDLLKIHPFGHGTMMSYSPSGFMPKNKLGKLYRDPGRGIGPIEFHQYVSASLAYGHMLILGYGYDPRMARTIHYHAVMMGVQQEYLTDNAADIAYHNGKDFVSTSRALLDGALKLGRVRVRYSRGLTVHVNYNADANWTVHTAEGTYELPPYGWAIVKPGEILSFSALVNGHRVDYVRCHKYVYLNTGDAAAKVEALDVQGAVWLKRTDHGWRLIPCGDLGRWERFPTPGLPEQMYDFRLTDAPADRGCARIAIDTQALMGKAPAEVEVQARNEAGQPVGANVKAGERLEVAPSADAVDYLLR